MVRPTRKEPKVGDLVYHWIFPRSDWMALLLQVQHAEQISDEKALVKMVPGVKHENYFKTMRKAAGNGTGWVFKKWLWVYDDSGSAAEIIESFFRETR